MYRQIVVPSVKTLLLREWEQRRREGSRRAAALYRAGLKPTIGSGPNGVPVPVEDPSSIGQRADKFLLPSSERSEGDRLHTRWQVGGCARARAHCVEWASPRSLPRMTPARGACTLALLMLCMLTAAARYALAGEADMGAGGQVSTLAGAAKWFVARFGSPADWLQLAARCGGVHVARTLVRCRPLLRCVSRTVEEVDVCVTPEPLGASERGSKRRK